MNGSTDKEKAEALNTIMKETVCEPLEMWQTGNGAWVEIRDRYRNGCVFKYRVVYSGQSATESFHCFSDLHTIMAQLILDLPKTKNEHPLVSNLRENYEKIIRFSKNNRKKLEFKNIDEKYQRDYREMIKHILISDKNKPTNLDYKNIERKDNLTYIIRKK